MSTLVFAPHPDDELLGCGGLMLRRVAEGVAVGWVVMTDVRESEGWPAERVRQREREIEAVREGVGVRREHLYRLGFPTTRLDGIPRRELVEKVGACIRDFQPREVLVPFRGDVHDDHKVTFDVVASCVKWFRYPSVRRVLVYETLSETDFGFDQAQSFRPNLFIEIAPWIERKVELLKIYGSELGVFPFPRSERAVRALAELRGARAGYIAAEGFMLLMERDDAQVREES